MTAKTHLSENEITTILSNYDLGELINSQLFLTGTVQTNIFMRTTKGAFVLRHYQNRSNEAVQFETHLCAYLSSRHYPCPAPFKNHRGEYTGLHNKKPYVIFEFMPGEHIEKPTEKQKDQLIQKVAELQIITRDYQPCALEHRFNYDINSCREKAAEQAAEINTINAALKLEWFEKELAELQLPDSLAKGICHNDFHFTNVLYHHGKFNALIDFDDANYTYLAFDLIWLIDPFKAAFNHDNWYNCKIDSSQLDFKEARDTIAKYKSYRPLDNSEKQHLFDLYKLSILFDCIWYFARGDVNSFYEKEKINLINSLGREGFYQALFTENKQ
ncbi:homoserine kinase [Psychromonas ossibalaenae]|uniref:homoserine kinase n=1 Tax=Psychromonas ossibalaenae TaxID=444922 RepID=UPI00037ECDDE|nr:homoserine kinase [Psychromonas ossibalaenae]